MSDDLAGKTLFITGGSRGIGLAIALRAARDGANVAIAAKTAEPQPKLPGTIHTAAAEIEAARRPALPLRLRHPRRSRGRRPPSPRPSSASAASTSSSTTRARSASPARSATPMKRFDLMFGVNVRGTFLCSQACLPHLQQSAAAGRNPHILTLSPPLNMEPKWFAPHVAYTMAKYGMSMCVLGMAEEFRGDGIAVNALWPRTVIATAAIAMIPGAAEQTDRMRKPEIMADAAHVDPHARRADDDRQFLHRRRGAARSRRHRPRPLRDASRARRCCPDLFLD